MCDFFPAKVYSGYVYDYGYKLGLHAGTSGVAPAPCSAGALPCLDVWWGEAFLVQRDQPTVIGVQFLPARRDDGAGDDSWLPAGAAGECCEVGVDSSLQRSSAMLEFGQQRQQPSASETPVFLYDSQ